MGNLFKSQTNTTKSPFETNPWEPQQGALKQGMSSASDALSAGLGNIGGVQDFTANMNKQQTGFIDQITGQAGSNSAIGDQAAQAGASAFGNFQTANQNLEGLLGQAGQDRTGAIISGAQQFADNPHLQGQIDATIGDIRRGFDDTRSSINSGASSTGNINSTRAGALDAMAMDDAMDRSAQVSSSMRGQAYESGLDRSTAEQARQFGDQFAVNGALGNSAMQGADLAGFGTGLNTSALANGLDAATLLQGQQQNEINGQITGASAPMNLINQYMQAIGRNMGQSGYTSQTTQSASPFQQLAGGAVAGLGAWGSFK